MVTNCNLQNIQTVLYFRDVAVLRTPAGCANANILLLKWDLQMMCLKTGRKIVFEKYIKLYFVFKNTRYHNSCNLCKKKKFKKNLKKYKILWWLIFGNALAQTLDHKYWTAMIKVIFLNCLYCRTKFQTESLYSYLGIKYCLQGLLDCLIVAYPTKSLACFKKKIKTNFTLTQLDFIHWDLTKHWF